MPYLSQTFESYQRVRIYTYSVNDLGLKKFVQKYGIYGGFTVCRQNIMPQKSPSAFNAIVFYMFEQLIFLFMESICTLFWTEMIICT